MLGVQLIQRSTHELSLTEAGQRFLVEARGLLAGWESLAEALRLERSELKGPMRVAAPIGLGQTLLADIACRFVARHPGVSLEWPVVDEPGDLAGAGIDLWIRVGPVRDASLVVRGLWSIQRAVVAAAGTAPARHPDELADRPAVVLQGYVGREVELTGPGGESASVRPQAAFATDNIFAARIATRAGLGWAFLPLWLVQEEIDAGTLVQLCPGWRPPTLTLSVAYPTGRYRPARVGAFLKFLRAELPRTGAGIVALSGVG